MISPEAWETADNLILEPNALLCMQELKRHVAVTAGPGAGKTEALAQRADYLFRTNSCPYPRRILAISFKLDAAHNLNERVTMRSGAALAQRFDSMTFHGFAKRIIDRYRPVLTGPHALDVNYTVGKEFIPRRQLSFDRMVPFAMEILERNLNARWSLRQTYSHVFLDEFQDCTSTQYQLIREAFRGSDTVITAVGDTKQRIMGWAGAMEGIFLTMASDFETVPLNLYMNFRSKDRLRRVQNVMVLAMDPGAAIDPATIPADEGEVHALAFESSADEAHGVGKAIAHLVADGTPLAQIAVLLSKQIPYYAADLMADLDRRGIPYRDETKLQDLASDPVSLVVFDFLRVCLLKQQSASYERILALAGVGTSDEESEDRLRSKISRYLASSREMMNDPKFVRTDTESYAQAVKNMLNLLGKRALSALSSDYQQGKRLEDLVTEALDVFATAVRSSGDPVLALDHFSDDKAVRILTIHKSKGLEFENVFVMACEAETFWGSIDEERSAFFVAISRAKDRLYVTHAKHRPRPPGISGRWDVNRTPHQEFFGYLDVT
ncbi:UvrD-helicase domain-containing protein [Cryobacterium sp. MDB2-10]|uniref:UvrD-helicase domain-containing protein n=1 Tax=Cryobacterium sp. MDB2-10 TaxID=1259177 RepID=UPI001074323F|nr:ATP-dependent helicase [Cryobacterium sp. MDB2-10]TFC19893.1 ATP-dependent helicase [Cryobacterium sp. MDB2-10]